MCCMSFNILIACIYLSQPSKAVLGIQQHFRVTLAVFQQGMIHIPGEQMWAHWNVLIHMQGSGAWQYIQPWTKWDILLQLFQKRIKPFYILIRISRSFVPMYEIDKSVLVKVMAWNRIGPHQQQFRKIYFAIYFWRVVWNFLQSIRIHSSTRYLVADVNVFI